MGRPVRRSARAPKRENPSTFRVGDTVEVERNGERVQGRLMTTENSHGRWTVQVAGKDQEFEQLFPVDTTTETDSSHTNTAASAREVRSRRRQEEPKPKKRKASPTTTSTSNNKTPVKRQRSTDEPECVKIKLLTGTLLLYRGRNQRAEFVRRV